MRATLALLLFTITMSLSIVDITAWYYYRFPAGGWKVNLLKAELERRKGMEEEEGMMLFTDSYDVVFTAGIESILGNYYLQMNHLIFIIALRNVN